MTKANAKDTFFIILTVLAAVVIGLGFAIYFSGKLEWLSDVVWGTGGTGHLTRD